MPFVGVSGIKIVDIVEAASLKGLEFLQIDNLQGLHVLNKYCFATPQQ